MKEVLVTRTVITTKGKVRGMTKGKTETEAVDYNLPGDLNEEQALKALKKQYTGKEFIPVYIETIEKEETLYGMPLQDFISSEKTRKLPARKVNEEKE